MVDFFKFFYFFFQPDRLGGNAEPETPLRPREARANTRSVALWVCGGRRRLSLEGTTCK